MRTSNKMRGMMVGALAIAVAGGCSGDKKDKDDKKPTSKNAPKTQVTAKPGTTAKRAPRRPSGGFGCDMIKRMPKDGEVSAIEHVAGKDNLGLEVVGGKAALRAGTTMTGSVMRLQMRGSYAEVESQGRKACVAISRLTFSLPRFKPELNKAIPYSFTGDLAEVTRGRVPAIYVDINETKAIAGTAKPTVEYVGTKGSFKFVKLNESARGQNKHTIEFSVLFQKVAAGKLDPAVKTKLTGQFSLETRRPL